MNNLLSEFEQQFAAVTAEITSKTSILLNRSLSPGENYKYAKEIKNLISDAGELLERMELEVKEAPQDQREKLKTRVKSYEVELGRLEGEFLKAHRNPLQEESDARRELLSGGRDNGDECDDEEQRQSLLNNTESLERTNIRLTQSYRAAIDSEQVGAQVLNDLQSQRDTLRRARERLHDTDEDLNQSSRVLNVMMKRAMQNKFLLGAILAFVLVAVVVIVYIKAS